MCTVSLALFVAGLGGGFQSAGTREPDIPTSLLEMLRNRSAITTSRVEWSLESASAPLSGRRFHTSQSAGESRLMVDRGDEDGILIRRSDGTIPPQPSGLPRMLHDDQKAWDNSTDGIMVEMSDLEGGLTRLRDPLTFGLLPAPLQHVKCDGVLERAFGWNGQPVGKVSTFQEWEESGLVTVRAYGDDVPYATEWTLDPGKGWAPVSSRWVSMEGEMLFEARSALKQVDGRWFPEAVLYFRSTHEGGRVPYETIEVQKAEFDHAEHPQRLTPEDAGVEFGTEIRRMQPDGPPLAEPVFWDGQRLIDRVEYQRLRKAGRPLGVNNQAYQDKLASGWVPGQDSMEEVGDFSVASLVKQTEDAWDRYTREFIAKYSLRESQSTRAWESCAKAKKSRDEYLARRKDEFKQTSDEHERTSKASGSDADQGRLRLQAKWRSLVIPVERRFVLLKEELRDLPTVEQRKEALAKASRAAGP